MYEILLDWGLKTLSKYGENKNAENIAFLKGAISVKNALVVKRFEISWNATQAFIALSSQIGKELYQVSNDCKLCDGMSKNKVIDLIDKIHAPKYYEFCSIRPQFDAVNDLLSAYIIEIDKFIQKASIEKIFDAKFEKNEIISYAVFNGILKNVWSASATTISSLMRIMSSDMRFWLSDYSYYEIAKKRAEDDISMLKTIFISTEKIVFENTFEKKDGLKNFWKDFENQHSEN